MIRVCSCAFVVELYFNRQDSLCLCPICAKLLIRSPCREKIPNGTRRNPNSQMVFAFRMDQWSPRIARRGEMSASSIMSGFRGFKGCQCYSRSRVIHLHLLERRLADGFCENGAGRSTGSSSGVSCRRGRGKERGRRTDGRLFLHRSSATERLLPRRDWILSTGRCLALSSSIR